MVKLSSLYKAIVVIFVAFMVGVPLLFPIEIIGSSAQRIIIILVSILLCIPILSDKNTELKREFKFLNQYFFLYILVIIIMVYFSRMTYGYSWDQLVKGILLEYLLPIAAFPIIFIFHTDNSIKGFLSLVSKIVLFMLFIRMFSWVMYNFRGQIYFSRLLFQYEEWIRDGFQRIESGMLYGITLVFVAVQSLNNRMKGLIYKCLLAFMILFLLVVTRVRFQTFISVLTVGAIYSFYKTKTKGGFLLKTLLFICLFGMLIFNSQLLETFVDKISTSGQYGASTAVRFQGVDHYLSVMAQKNAYFGLGFLLKGNYAVNTLMARNQWSIYYLDDLGMLGTFVQIGLFTIVTHIFLFIKAVQVTIKCFKQENKDYLLYSLGLTIYLIGSCLLLNIFDKQRIFDVPVYLAIYSFLDARVSGIFSNKKHKVGMKGPYGGEV